MTIYYLSSADGSDASDGLSWDNAFATFKYGVETASAAASGPHLLYVDSAHSESLSADTTITAAGNLQVLCVNRASGNALTTGAVVGAQATNYGITINGGHDIYVYGLTFKNGTNTAAAKDIIVGAGDPAETVLESCRFELANNASNDVFLGTNAVAANELIKLINVVFKFGNAGNRLIPYAPIVEMENCSVDATGVAPTVFIGYSSASTGIRCEGCDWSHITTTFLHGQDNGEVFCELINCKLGAGVTLKAANTVTNRGGAAIVARNCDAGDNHYVFYHADCYGETSVSTSVYANDGAAYDGTNKCSWKIVTTANPSYYMPYVSPWMDVYHSGKATITPYLECLRSGSTTKYQNDEIWTEWSYQGTNGSTKASFVNDRMIPLGTPEDQTASNKTAADWTGEDVSNNAFMKLEAGSITPAEIGYIRARVCVGEPSITVYVDPMIRGVD